MELEDKIRVLTEGAKYDVSCSSSGSSTASKRGQLGNCAVGGICHSFTNDGRCISLLKILMSNNCEYDCLYCINRRGNDIERARLEPREICQLVIDFYKRNYIEGLFLSSAVDKSPAYTMQKLIETVELLRVEYKFRGYIHLKGIPNADKEMLEYASQWVDRMSFNIELPSESSLKLLAPQKSKQGIIEPMKMLSDIYIKEREIKSRLKIPAGQTTQMIIGATPDADGQIIRLSQALYDKFAMKRVYYSSYVPVNQLSNLPSIPSDLRRENRLYQADWLLRFYGYRAEELVPLNYNLSLDIDPKTDWALRNYDKFPIEINTASYEILLRVPGIGVRNAYRIIKARCYNKIDEDALKRMRVVTKRAQHFITVNGKFLGYDSPEKIYSLIARKQILLEDKAAKQLSFFDSNNSNITGDF